MNKIITYGQTLAIFCLAAILPTILVSALAMRASFNEIQQQTHEQIDNLKQSIDTHIGRVNTEILTLKSEYRQCDTETINLLRDRIYATPLLQEIYVTNPDGLIVCDAYKKVDPPIQGKVPPEGTKLRVAGPLNSPFTNDFVLSFSSTGYNGFEVTGLISYLSLDRWINAYLPNLHKIWLRDLEHDKIIYSNQVRLKEGRELAAIPNSQNTLYLGYEKDESVYYFAHAVNLRAYNEWQFVIYSVAPTPWQIFLSIWQWVVLTLLLFGVIASFVLFNRKKQQLTLEYRLRRAIDKQHFTLVYQPIVKLSNNQLIGAEALIRWRNKNGEDISMPDEFIPVAEHHGWIVEITQWLIAQAIKDLAQFNQQFPDFIMSVNVAPTHFAEIDLDIAEQALQQFPELSKRQIKFELTERGIMDEGFNELQGVLTQARDKGFQVAIDDFGTGQSGFNYLSSLDFDLLKIDRQFVKAIGSGSVDEYLVDIIVDIAHRLDVNLIAEGIESEYELKHLLSRHVEYGQGYFYSRPLALGELVAKYKS